MQLGKNQAWVIDAAARKCRLSIAEMGTFCEEGRASERAGQQAPGDLGTELKRLSLSRPNNDSRRLVCCG